MKKYNLTKEQITNLKGICEICGKEESKANTAISIDHCHKSNTFRGELCHKCNIGLGHFEDNTTLLKKAIRYLAAFELKSIPETDRKLLRGDKI